MNTVVLNYGQVLSFTQLKQGYITKNGQKAIFRKLTNMGMCNINVTGRGKSVIYQFEIPNSFWKLLQVPSIKFKTDENYFNVLSEVMDMILDGTICSDGIVDFHSVFIAKIASKYEKNYKAVEYHASKIKSHFNKCGLLATHKKSHRIKFNEMKTWATGTVALKYDEKIKEMWKDFFAKHFKFYKATKLYNGYDQSIPYYLIKRYADEFRYYIIDLLRLDAYKVAKEVTATNELLDDIEWSRETFFRTLDMDLVRSEIRSKHKTYKEEITALVHPRTVNDINEEYRASKRYEQLYKERPPTR